MSENVEKVKAIIAKMEDLQQDIKDCSVLIELDTFDEVNDNFEDTMHSLDQMRLELLGW